MRTKTTGLPTIVVLHVAWAWLLHTAYHAPWSRVRHDPPGGDTVTPGDSISATLLRVWSVPESVAPWVVPVGIAVVLTLAVLLAVARARPIRAGLIGALAITCVALSGLAMSLAIAPNPLDLFTTWFWIFGLGTLAWGVSAVLLRWNREPPRFGRPIVRRPPRLPVGMRPEDPNTVL